LRSVKLLPEAGKAFSKRRARDPIIIHFSSDVSYLYVISTRKTFQISETTNADIFANES
jgi:hypothetical protein